MLYHDDGNSMDTKGILANVCIRLTRRCNLNCKICLASNSFDDMSIENVNKSIEILTSLGMQCVRLTGGEPFLRNDIFEIIDFCLYKKLKVIVFSNLYDIDTKFSEIIKRSINITTSLHGDNVLPTMNLPL
ncbi:hypothetical protein FACS1894190_16240 [Spirochaetia bacterium]|nr:hypothetical protein FACS1894190_16240 [Spirochaetia bacterium]